MPSLTSQLIISLVDRVSGPSRGAAAALQNLGKVEKSLVANRSKWGDNFSDQLARMKLSARELEQVGRSFEQFQHRLAAAGTKMKASAYVGALDQWKSRTVANINAVRAAAEQAEAAQARMWRGWRGGARFAAGTVGVGSAAYGAQRGFRGMVRATAEYEREGGRAYLAGMTPAEAIKAQAISREATRRYPSIDSAQIMERLRNLRSFTGDFDKGAGMLEDQLQGLTVLQSLKGKDRAMQEMQDFMRGLDVLGKNEDGSVVGNLMNAYVKALGVDNDLNMGQFSQFARKSKAAGAAFSNEFLGAIVPTFMQDMGGPEMGTALGTEVSQTVAGRGTKKSKAYQQKAGLRDAKGKMVDPDLLLSNPYEWVSKYGPDAMRKMKLDPSKELDVTKFMAEAFSAQTVANLFGRFVTQRQQAERNKLLYANGPDMQESSKKLRDLDPFVAAEGFMAQLRNLGSALAEGPLKQAVPMLNAFTDAIARLTETLSKNPEYANAAGWGAAGVGSAAGGMALWMLGKKGLNWLRGGNATTMQSLATEAAAAETAASAPKTSMWGRVGSGAFGASAALGPALQMATQPDIVDMKKPRDWWSDKYIQPLWQKFFDWRANSKAETAAEAERRKINFGDYGGASPKLEVQPPSMENLDQSGPAGGAGQKTGEAYKRSVETALQQVDPVIAAAVQRWIGMLSFSANPTITPNIGTPAGGGGNKGASLNSIAEKQHAAFADYGFNTV